MAKYEKPTITVNLFLEQDVLTSSNEQEGTLAKYDNFGSWSWDGWQKD